MTSGSNAADSIADNYRMLHSEYRMNLRKKTLHERLFNKNFIAHGFCIFDFMRNWFILLLLSLCLTQNSRATCAHFSPDDTVIYTGKTMLLDSVFFDFDHYSIAEKSYPALNTFASWLLKFPGIKIEIAYHSDCRGAESEKKMSRRLGLSRARSIQDYLLGQGIHYTRMKAVSYNSTRPQVICGEMLKDHPQLTEGKICDCDYIHSFRDKNIQEYLYAVNRRIEITILEC